MLHRDLKPSNVLIDEQEVARIADFGLAEASAIVRGTRTREGSPRYMSPEQLAGREATLRSDIYALGLVLYEMFAGVPAYPGGSWEEILRQREAPLPPLSVHAPGLDPAVERTIRRCLEVDPQRRPSSARAVAAALPGGGALTAALEAAQQRADRIAAFRAELRELRRTGVPRLDEATLTAVERHHRAQLRDLVWAFDVDVTERGRQFSLGMRIVSAIGAVAPAASLYYFFYRIWEIVSLPVQIGVLVGVPAGALLITALVASRERTGHFTTMAATLALAGMVLDTTVLSGIFNLGSSPGAFLMWATFVLTLAYGFRLRLLLAVGTTSLAVGLAGALVQATGGRWTDCRERWESFLPAGVLTLLVPVLVRHPRHPGFAPLYRSLGLVLLFLPVIILANEGGASFLPLSRGAVEGIYQLAGFAGGAAAIAMGIAGR